jgi:hypothetical protein
MEKTVYSAFVDYLVTSKIKFSLMILIVYTTKYRKVAQNFSAWQQP